MGRVKEMYIEMHSLEWDIQHSACKDCPYNECQYYYNNCPHDKGVEL